MRHIIFGFLLSLSLCLTAWADVGKPESEIELLKAQIENLRKDFEQSQQQHEAEVMQIQDRIRELADQIEAQRVTRQGEAEVPYASFEKVQPPEYTAAAARPISQVFNPDISVIGDVLGQLTSHEDKRPDDEFIFRELEINLSGALDPFARADATVAIGKVFAERVPGVEQVEGEDAFEIDIEEAYLTALTLPHGLQARVGRMREKFGKTNPLHLHALPWVEEPLMIQNYFGEEGLAGDGVEVSWLAPTDHYLELTYEVFNNDNDSSFAGGQHNDVVHLVHAKNLFELSDATTVELGGTLATGPNDRGHGGQPTWLEGIDLTMKWLPPQRSLYEGLTWQTEALLSQKDTDEGEQDTWGLFSSLEYRLSRRWKVAARYDYSEFPDSEDLREKGYSAYLKFIQSEFVFWRLGYMFVDRNFPDPVDEDEHLLWVQLNFGLGPHRAHEY